MRVLIVDDHSMVRAGIAKMLERISWEVVGEAATLESAMGLSRTASWDVMVLDLHLPDGDGLDLLKMLREQYRMAQPILVHSLLPDSAAAARVFKAGGSGFISKTCEPEDFLQACQTVVTGRRYVSPEYADSLVSSMSSGSAQVLHETLSEREFQALELFAEGKTPTQLAEEMKCSVNTISTYRARILRKLKLKNSADIVRYAMQHKLVKLS